MNTRIAALFALLSAGQALGAANVMPAPIAPDYDGNGYSDVLFYGVQGDPSKATLQVDCRGMYKGEPAVIHSHLVSDIARPGWEVYTGDFDGDGSDDAFLYDPTRAKGVGHLVRMTDDCHTQSSVMVADEWRTTWEVYPGDFDGDGADDLFLYDPTGNKGVGHLVRFDANGLIYSSHPVTQNWRTTWEIIPGDFDGDGADDLFMFDPTPGEGVAHLVRFSPQGYISSSHPVGGGFPVSMEFYPGDFDGNGSYDLLAYHRAGTLGGEMRTLRFGSNGNIYSDTLLNRLVSPQYDVTVADMNGDDQAELFLYLDFTGSTQSFALTFDINAQLQSLSQISASDQSDSVMFPGHWWDGAGVDLMKVEVGSGDIDVARFSSSFIYDGETWAYSAADLDMGFNGFYDF